MKNTVTLTSSLDPHSFDCKHGTSFYLCRAGVASAFPEALTAPSLTIETRLKPAKVRGERKVVVLDAHNVRVGRKVFGITLRRNAGMARVLGIFGRESFTFYVSLKK